MYYLIAIVGGVVFGGADQYLGSLPALGAWTAAVSGMSAPWLVLPFAFGVRERDPRRAMAAGLVVTYAALIGYFAMTLTPIEGVSLSHVSLVAELRSQLHVLVPALASGPLCGLCGYWWRVRRAPAAAILVAASLCLEPAARALAGQLSPTPVVWVAEVLAGLGLTMWFVRVAVTSGHVPDKRG